jgi:hypothetical protein
MLTMVSAIASSTEKSVLTAVQLMWINLFQDTLAALALATDPPAPTILDKKPDPRSAPLITIPMWKMIFGQSAYQVAITLILHFGGATILNYHTDHELTQLQTIVFNAYVWMNIFNMYKYVYSISFSSKIWWRMANGFFTPNLYSNFQQLPSDRQQIRYPGGSAPQLALHRYHHDHDRRPGPTHLRWWRDFFGDASHRGPVGHFRRARRAMYPLWLLHAPHT